MSPFTFSFKRLEYPLSFFKLARQAPNWSGCIPLVEIKVGKGTFTPEQLERLGKDVTDQVTRTYQELKGVKPKHVWVIFHEVPPDNWLLSGVTLRELKAKAKKGK